MSSKLIIWILSVGLLISILGIFVSNYYYSSRSNYYKEELIILNEDLESLTKVLRNTNLTFDQIVNDSSNQGLIYDIDYEITTMRFQLLHLEFENDGKLKKIEY